MTWGGVRGPSGRPVPALWMRTRAHFITHRYKAGPKSPLRALEQSWRQDHLWDTGGRVRWQIVFFRLYFPNSYILHAYIRSSSSIKVVSCNYSMRIALLWVHIYLIHLLWRHACLFSKQVHQSAFHQCCVFHIIAEALCCMYMQTHTDDWRIHCMISVDDCMFCCIYLHSCDLRRVDSCGECSASEEQVRIRAALLKKGCGGEKEDLIKQYFIENSMMAERGAALN